MVRSDWEALLIILGLNLIYWAIFESPRFRQLVEKGASVVWNSPVGDLVVLICMPFMVIIVIVGELIRIGWYKLVRSRAFLWVIIFPFGYLLVVIEDVFESDEYG